MAVSNASLTFSHGKTDPFCSLCVCVCCIVNCDRLNEWVIYTLMLDTETVKQNNLQNG